MIEERNPQISTHKKFANESILGVGGELVQNHAQCVPWNHVGQVIMQQMLIDGLCVRVLQTT